MSADSYLQKARSYLAALCSQVPNRSAGSPGNLLAVNFFTRTIGQWSYTVDTTPFLCQDFWDKGSTLVHNGRSYEVYSSPFSVDCDITAELVVASRIEELELCACKGKILLMKGALCDEHLMPQNHPFYNPDHHKQIYALLEEKQPAGIVTATGKNPVMMGALYPYPLIEDGDFDIPSVFCTEKFGEVIAAEDGETFHLVINAGRISSEACNVIARRNPDALQKIVVCAHIDTKATTRGAIDNASGTVMLLLLAEMLDQYKGSMGIEIVAVNGEDHYSAGGEVDYLNRYGWDLDNVIFAVNVDGIGYIRGDTAFSFYEFPEIIARKARSIFSTYSGMAEGNQWYAGDHMVFVQKGKPAIALTSGCIAELSAEVLHSPKDTPELVDCAKLIEVADAVKDLIAMLEKDGERHDY